MKIKFFILSCFVIWLAGCGAPASPAGGEVRFLLSEDAAGVKGYQQIIDAFQIANPKIKVTLTNVPGDSDFLKRLAADFAAKAPPDVFVINYRRFGQFAIKGALEPMDTYIASSATFQPADFYPIARDAFKFKGRQYCIPQNLSSLQVYYNKKLYAAANLGVPREGWTWDEFLRDARALTQGDQYGAGISPQVIRLAPFIWAHGGEIVDDPNQPTKLWLDAPAAREAFEWFVNLQVKERVVPNKADEATASSQTRFQNGKLGMFFQSRVITPDLRETIKDFEWDIAQMPRDKNRATILHSDGYCIASGARNKVAAWAFVEFANNAAGQGIIVTSGRTVPSRQSVADTPLFLANALLPASSRVYLDMAPHIRRVPIMTSWLEIEERVNAEIKRAFYGDASLDEALRAAQSGTVEFFKQNLDDLNSK